MKLAFGYCRCSTTKQEKSIPEQKAAIGRWARQNGYEVTAWYQDEGMSGNVFEERPGFRAMLDACREREHDGKIVAVLVWDKSRFGRPGDDLKEATVYEQAIERTGKSIVYVSSGRISDGSLTSAILDTVENAAAADFLHKLSSTITRHQFENAKAGFSTGRKAPFGYDLLVVKADGSPRHRVHYTADVGKNKYRKSLIDPTTGAVKEELGPDARLPRFERTDRSRLLLGDPAEAVIVREIYASYRAGRGFKSIADGLNARGAPSPNGKVWHDSAVREVLMNPVYTGAMVAGRRSEGKFHTLDREEGPQRRAQRPKRTRKGNVKVELRQEAEWIVVENAHPAIVTRAEWEEVQKLRAGRDKQKTHRGRPSVFRLTGLVVCEHCKHRYVGMSRPNQKGTMWRCYVCNGRMSAGRTVCDWNTVRQDKLEGPIIEGIQERYFSIETEEALEAQVRAELEVDAADHTPEVERTRERIGEIDRKIRILVDQLIARPEHADIFSVRIAEAKAEKATAERRLSELEGMTARRDDLGDAIRKTFAELQELKVLFESQDVAKVDRQKEALRKFVKEVRLDPATREVTVHLYPLSKMLVGARGWMEQEHKSTLMSGCPSRACGADGGGLLLRTIARPRVAFERLRRLLATKVVACQSR